MTTACIDLSNVFDGDASDGTTRTLAGEMQKLQPVLRNIPVISVVVALPRVWVCGRCLLSLSAYVPTPFDRCFTSIRLRLARKEFDDEDGRSTSAFALESGISL
jgi:hypothetical protein